MPEWRHRHSGNEGLHARGVKAISEVCYKTHNTTYIELKVAYPLIR